MSEASQDLQGLMVVRISYPIGQRAQRPALCHREVQALRSKSEVTARHDEVRPARGESLVERTTSTPLQREDATNAAAPSIRPGKTLLRYAL